MSRVLVTGGAGFGGVPLVRELLQRGHDVIVADDFSVGGRARLDQLAEQITIAEVDVRDSNAIQQAVADAMPTAVVHLAALHFIPWCNAEPARAVAINVQGTANVLAAATAAKVERVVYASTADVYPIGDQPHDEDELPAPTGVYGISKLAGELLLQSWARTTGGVGVATRLFNFYGPGETNPHLLPDIVDALKLSDVLHLGNLTPRRDYIYVADTARVLAALIDHPEPPTTVNVGTGTSASVEEVVDLIRELTGRPIQVRQDPAKLRPVDRPNLQARNDRLRAALPDLTFVHLADGLRRLLEAEGLLPKA